MEDGAMRSAKVERTNLLGHGIAEADRRKEQRVRRREHYEGRRFRTGMECFGAMEVDSRAGGS